MMCQNRVTPLKIPHQTMQDVKLTEAVLKSIVLEVGGVCDICKVTFCSING